MHSSLVSRLCCVHSETPFFLSAKITKHRKTNGTEKFINSLQHKYFIILTITYRLVRVPPCDLMSFLHLKREGSKQLSITGKRDIYIFYLLASHVESAAYSVRIHPSACFVSYDNNKKGDRIIWSV